MPRTSDFSEAQKAFFYKRDRATCVYSGDNLWILDGGATTEFTVDWADHLNPVSKEGVSSEANGVCAGWNHNKKKSDSLEIPNRLLIDGKPNQPYFDELPELVRRRLTSNLDRFSRLELSDWYFNRALFRLLNGVEVIDKPECVRTSGYFARSSLKALKKWRIARQREQSQSLADRGLTPVAPSPDQVLMLEIQSVTTEASLFDIMLRLQPTYIAGKSFAQ